MIPRRRHEYRSDPCNLVRDRIPSRTAGRESLLRSGSHYDCFRTAVIVSALVFGAGCKDKSDDASKPSGPIAWDEFIKYTNIGKAHYETRDFEKALAAFESAWKVNPGEPGARINLALTLMEIQGRRQEALEHLKAALIVEPDSAAAHYLVGLCLFHAGPEKIPERVKALERAVKLDPEIAIVRWQLGHAYRAAGQDQKAYEQFKECVRLDPLHWSGFNSLKSVANLLDKPEEAKRAYDTMLKIKALRGDDPRPPDELERCRHTRVRTPYLTMPAGEAISVSFVEISDEAGLVATEDGSADPPVADSGALSIIDFNEDGGLGLLATDRLGRPTLFRNARQGRFESDDEASGVLPGVANAAITVDFGNDGRNDLLLTGASGTRLCRRVRFEAIDAFPKAPNASSEKHGGLVAAADFDNDGRVDLFATDSAGRARMFRNVDRANFVDVSDDWNLPGDALLSACLVADFSNNDRPDLVLGGPYGLRLMLNDDGRSLHYSTAPSGVSSGAVTSMTASDIDSDLDLDLLFVIEGTRPRLLRNEGEGRFRDVSDQVGLPPSVADLHQIATFDVNGDNRLDIILLTEMEVPGPLSESAVLLAGPDGLYAPPTPDANPRPRIASGRVGVVRSRGELENAKFLRVGGLGASLWETGVTDSLNPDLGGLHVLGAEIVDFDSDGRDDLLLVGSGGTGERPTPQVPKLLRGLENEGWLDVSGLYGLDAIGRMFAHSVAVADYDGDGDQDFVFGTIDRGLIYVEYDKRDRWITMTDGSELGAERAGDVVPIDFDVDGDLDVLTSRIGGGLGLWRNNGDGTFVDAFAGKPDVQLPNESFVRIAVADFAGNDAPDIVAVGPAGVCRLVNRREGTFAPPVSPAGKWPGATAVCVDDFNNDGMPDVITASDGEFTLRTGPDLAPSKAPAPDTIPIDIASFDYDNDGWTDLLIASGDTRDESRLFPLRLFRNLDNGRWDDVSESTGILNIRVNARRVATGDFEGDGDTDIFLATADRGTVLLRNDGGDRNHQVKIGLVGTKTNRNGIGVRVEARSGTFRANRVVTRYPIELGIGSNTGLDSIRTVWTNGIIQQNIEVDAFPSKMIEITEPIVAAGSCPYLYAWSGSDFEFVTDLLGNSPAGLSYARGKYLPSDPTEFVKIGDIRDFPQRDGKFVLQATDELREIFYLDEARLVVADHPADVSVFSNDKIRFPPFEDSAISAATRMRLPTRAIDARGLDCTDALAAIDSVFTDPGRPERPQFRGNVPAHSIALEFDGLNAAEHNLLALTGWLQYGDASVNISMSQSPRSEVVMPRLQALRGDGSVEEVDVVVGMPAGKTKTIIVDLSGKLPEGATALRLTTTFEIRWDRIALFERSPESSVRLTDMNLAAADLHFRGFGDIYPHVPNGPYTPDYADPAAGPPWQIGMRGWCTRYGDVRELLDTADNEYVILNSGDEVTLSFDGAGLPPLPSGWVRELFFYSVGWDKDMDHNVRAGETVEPLPYLGMDDQAYGADDAPTAPELAPWNAKYNTRYVPADRFLNRPTGNLP